jgi:hypothetical protein
MVWWGIVTHQIAHIFLRKDYHTVVVFFQLIFSAIIHSPIGKQLMKYTE